MPAFTEKSTVEDYILERLKEKGWKHLLGVELEREDYSESLLIGNFVRTLKRINENLDLSEGDVNRILAELRSKPASFEGSKHILQFLKQGIPIKLEKTKELRYVKLLDQENPDNNEFVVANQVWFESSRGKIKPDIVLYVNGIPLVVIECKNPTDPGVSWEDAYKQVKDYEDIVPELFKYVQFSIAAEATARYFPNVLGLKDVKRYLWREEGFEDELDATLQMLSKSTLVDLLVNFIFAREEHGTSTKVLPRYMQYHATNRVYDRVIGNLEGREEKNSGLVWHWQGSGKTLTMIFATYKLYRHPKLENPTVFLIVDRDELEEQLRTEFSCLDLGIAKPEVISSVANLREVLAYDECRGKRGVFITLIHKFREEAGEDLISALKFDKKAGETISSRRNVIAIIDEGHRTQYGKLAEQMRKVLRNAFFFAFTGTPISKTGRDTYLTFSYPPDEYYLHDYFVEDSIKDGFTLPIVFQTRMEKKVGLDKKRLEGFLAQELEEIPEDFRERVEQRVSRRLSDVMVFLKNPKRIEIISEDIANHFKENIDGKFKGMVVTADREACVIYKEKLDKFLPPKYTEIVMTFNPHADPDPIKRYYEKLREAYPGKQIDEIRNEIITRFKEEEHPKVLIVTDMLLTGFDAPILEVMYLDKPLKEHRLLQAIARTNRPFNGAKEAGLIIDYVGVMKEFQKALAIYRKQDVKYAAIRLEEEIKKFRDLLQETEEFFEGLEKGRTDRETLKSAVKILFHDHVAENDFLLKYKRLLKIYEFLGPRYFEPTDVERLRRLTAIYEFYRRWTGEREGEPEEVGEYFRRFFSRTLETIHRTIDIKMKEEFPILKLDADYLNNLRKVHSDIEDRVYDMVFALNRYVLVERSQKPLYEPIARKVERIVKEWKEKKVDVKEAYERLSEIVKETVDLGERQKKLGLSDQEYFMLVALEEKLGKSRELLQEVKSLWSGWENSGKLFEGWNRKSTVLKEIGKDIRRFLRKKGLPFRERDELYEKIIKGLKEL
jgi:type I restriction enzyme R subunit